MAPYVSAVDIETRLGGNVLGEQKAGLADALTSACTAIDVWCGQTFTTAVAATARTYQPVDLWRAKVDPFWTTTGLVIKTDTGDAGTFSTTWASTDYELIPFGGTFADQLAAPYDTIYAVGSNTFPIYGRRTRTLQVTAQWGWATPPQNVIEATKILTVDLWKRKDTPFGIATSTMDFAGLRISRDAMSGVAFLLSPFRRTDRTVGVA